MLLPCPTPELLLLLQASRIFRNEWAVQGTNQQSPWQNEENREQRLELVAHRWKGQGWVGQSQSSTVNGRRSEQQGCT